MFRIKRSTRWLSLLLALAIGFLPISPAFAAVSKAPDPHAAHAAPPENGKQASCDQHDGCQGQCCAACAHCFTAAVSMALVFKPSFPVQIAAHQQLHSFLMIAAHNRPPQTAI